MITIANCPHTSEERHGTPELQELVLNHMRDCQLHTVRRNTPKHVEVCLACGGLACLNCYAEQTIRVPVIADDAWICKLLKEVDGFADDHRACAKRDVLVVHGGARKQGKHARKARCR